MPASNMGWGFFKDEPRHLDHITRNMIIFVYLAYRRSTAASTRAGRP